MSTMTDAFDVSRAGPPTPHPAPGARPWGFWGTLGWSLFAVTTGFLAAMASTVIWMLGHQFRLPDPADAPLVTVVGMVASIATPAVLVIAVKIRKWPLRNYFALGGVRRRELALGVACLGVLIVAFGAAESMFGNDNRSTMLDAYRGARVAGTLPLLWLAMVVVAPVTEELVFRGFLHRGWAPSWLGVCGTVVMTSALWALLHQQYGWLGILFVFLMGLILGWLRQRTGSTTLTIVLHASNNLFATTILTLQLEWLS